MQNYLTALSSFFTLTSQLWFIGGITIGIIAGILPGVGASLSMSLLMPVTFFLPKEVGLVTLIGIWAGAVYGGSISSILINTPGTGANVATCFDGFPMARDGKAKTALGLSATSSMIGGLVGVTALVLFAQPLSKITLLFGSAEYFLLSVFGLVIVSVTIKGEAIKGLISSGIGLLIAFIGYDVISGRRRYYFGSMYLVDGIPFLCAVIGLFAVTQLIDFLEDSDAAISRAGLNGSIWEGIKGTFKYWKTLLKGAAIGTIFGFAPGVGTTAASMVSYGVASSSYKEGDIPFGEGNPEGVVAAEVANNAVQGGALIPALTLGIPGNSDSAVFLAGLMMYGLSPGRNLFEKSGDIVSTLFVALIFAQIGFWIVGLVATRLFAKITLVPIKILMPVIWIVALTGAFALRYEIKDCILVVILGVMGYYMNKFGFPQVPMLMGIILGEMAEQNFTRALMISDGSYSCFVSKPVDWLIIAIILGSFCIPLSRVLKARKKKNSEKE